MDGVIDEGDAGVEFGPGLAVDEEDVRTFDYGTAGYFGFGYTIGKSGFAETADETKFTDGGLGGDVGAHEYSGSS